MRIATIISDYALRIRQKQLKEYKKSNLKQFKKARKSFPQLKNIKK